MEYSHKFTRNLREKQFFCFFETQTPKSTSSFEEISSSPFRLNTEFLLQPLYCRFADLAELCKFKRMRLKDVDLLDMLISKTVSIAIEKGIIKSGTIIVDATHTASRSNPYAPVDILKQRSKLLRKAVYTIAEDRKGTLPQKNGDDDLEHELAYTDRLLTWQRAHNHPIYGKAPVRQFPGKYKRSF